MAYAGDAYAAAPYAGKSQTGPVTPSGTLTAILPSLTCSIDGGYIPPPDTGTLTASLPAFSGSLSGVLGTDYLLATLPSLSGALAAHVNAIAKSGSATRDGISVSASTVVDVVTPIAAVPAHISSPLLAIVTPTVPVPTLVDGRPQ